MADLTSCPYCLNGSSDPVICSYCGRNISEAVGEEECVFSPPLVGFLRFDVGILKTESRKEVVDLIGDYITRSEEYEDMSTLRLQFEKINIDDTVWLLELKDYMYESLTKLFSEHYGIGNKFWEFRER